MSNSVQREKVVSAEGMPADTLYKHCRKRHPGLLQLYPFVARLRVEHREEHELDERPKLKGYSFTHYHDDPE